MLCTVNKTPLKKYRGSSGQLVRGEELLTVGEPKSTERHNENNEFILFYINHGSPWFHTLAAVEAWQNGKEEERLKIEERALEPPDTRWMFHGFFSLDVKAVRDRQPLVETGPLPDWLRNLAHSRAIFALDTYQDNLCLWRCLAVHRWARVDSSTAAARQLAQANFNRPCRDFPKTSLDELDKGERFLNEGKPFKEWVGIRVYEPGLQTGGRVIWILRRNAPAKTQSVMTIGIFKGHASLIKKIRRLARDYVCKDCFARFTQVFHLHRHAKTCSQGETKVYCLNKRLEKPQTAFEHASFPDANVSEGSIPLLESESRQWGVHINHAKCGHGGERRVTNGAVDGFHPPSRTVVQ